MARAKKQDELEQQIGELTQDLQRVRADFENYRKRVEQEKTAIRRSGRASTVLQLLPVIDNIERAIGHMPSDLETNPWAEGVTKLIKNLSASLESIGVSRIEATQGTKFNPQLHEAIQLDDDAVGET